MYVLIAVETTGIDPALDQVQEIFAMPLPRLWDEPEHDHTYHASTQCQRLEPPSCEYDVLTGFRTWLKGVCKGTPVVFVGDDVNFTRDFLTGRCPDLRRLTSRTTIDVAGTRRMIREVCPHVLPFVSSPEPVYGVRDMTLKRTLPTLRAIVNTIGTVCPTP